MKFNLVVGVLIGVLYLPTIANTEAPSLADGVRRNRLGILSDECDLFSGEWIPDNSSPPYNATCEFILDLRNCMKNGRPDTGYLFWRWKPDNCNLHKFDPKKFLNAMRDKSLAMIGDSLLQNQMQSLLCTLSQVEKPIDTFQNQMRWYFHSYNFTVRYYWAPFLLDAYFISERNVKLHLDRLDSIWTTGYHRHDYIVIAAGPWFLSTQITMMKNNTIVGCHDCYGKYKELGAFSPYRRALQMSFDFITKSDHKPLVLFRTWSPRHFEYGDWNNGGICNRTTPYVKGQYDGTNEDHSYYAINMEEFNKATAIGAHNGTRLELFDTYHLSLLRPDGHPGPYMKFHPFDHKDKNARVQNDCVHWCLPGPIDTWNDLMTEMILNEGDRNSVDIS